MSGLAKKTKSTVISCLRYGHAPAAIEWLWQVFDFEKQLLVPPYPSCLVGMVWLFMRPKGAIASWLPTMMMTGAYSSDPHHGSSAVGP
jgi:hypothetical protein